MDALDKALLDAAEQRSQVWLDARVGKFTASEIWKLMSNPRSKSDKFSSTAMTYIMEKVAETLTGQAKQIGYAFPLVYGEELEPEARMWFEKVTGFNVEPCSFTQWREFAGGTPDGNLPPNKIVEFKCPYNSSVQAQYLMLKDMEDVKNEFPEYYWQCQANLMFTNTIGCYFATYDPRMKEDYQKMKIILITPDEDDHVLLVERLIMAEEEKQSIIKQITNEPV